MRERLLAGVLLCAGFLGWECYAQFSSVDDLILPAPSEIARALVDDRLLLWDNLLVTSQEILGGIVLALTLGISLALTLHLSKSLKRATYPLLVASQAVPIVVIAPLLVVWLGFGIAPKLVIIALVSFFPVVVTTLDGLQRVDQMTLHVFRSMGASRLKVLRFVELPATLPAAVSGAKIAVAVAVIGAVFAEYAGSSAGLGYIMLQAIPQLETARAWAAVFLLALFAVILVQLLTFIERRFLPSKHGVSYD